MRLFRCFLKGILRLMAAPDRAIKNRIANRYIYRLAHIDPTGIVEALLFSWRVDLWQRYTTIIDEIVPRSGCRLLDVGGGSGKVGEFLDPSNHFICVLDLLKDSVRQVKSPLHGIWTLNKPLLWCSS